MENEFNFYFVPVIFSSLAYHGMFCITSGRLREKSGWLKSYTSQTMSFYYSSPADMSVYNAKLSGLELMVISFVPGSLIL